MTVAEKPRKRAQVQEEPEQKDLPGMECVTNKKIRRIARQYKAAQRERMSAGEVEHELKEKLIAAMKEEGLESYKDKDIIITMTSKDTIKVKSPADDTGEEEGDEE